MSEKKITKPKREIKKASITKAIVGNDLITFKNQNTIRIEILECKDDITEINGKKRNQYSMKVIDLDDKKPKDFNTASARLRKLLSDLNESEGLIGQRLRIEHIGSGYNATFTLEKIE